MRRRWFTVFGKRGRDPKGKRPARKAGRLAVQRQRNIPALRKLLAEVIPRHITIEKFEIEHDFPITGRRTTLLNARKI
jgi:hypothetical protein